MADNTHIEWTDATWNPITGCSIVSPGCTHCYAMKLAGTRLKHTPSRKGLTVDTRAGPVWNGEVRFNEQWLDQPLRWKRPRRIFVCAHGDLFAEGVPDEWIDRVFAVMALSPQHTFQVLTKRAKRMREYLTRPDVVRRLYERVCDRVVDEQLPVLLLFPGIADPGLRKDWPRVHIDSWPLPNVWLGVSAERQQEADKRVPELLATPAAVRFVSAEPLLHPIDFGSLQEGLPPNAWMTWLDGLDWIIVGGESGKGARPMHPDWVRSIRDQCDAAGTAFFFKQWGEWAPICAIAETDDLYHPAPDTHPDAHRRCKHHNLVMHDDGAIFDCNDANDYHRRVTSGAFAAGKGAMTFFDIGKKAAGRLLDGVEHSAFPVRP